ncbi:Drug resistance transporter EmrB/QacA subfamily [Patulibacter medicamentivorans]|uniref:Drug resistance transporter EmrB/QacA subfamily n=1 Tax=Patulibacter medicamentivorans TaxID=1097667 RepID=H0E959_9ACTN|nr:DHA2 family efflux MFS transporter permease subunit [Patulibacter medicamentivorans]EHN09797.1 Drug resistance transporter EmrB/QacA subfamily [Patulibacter medicamentivorans]
MSPQIHNDRQRWLALYVLCAGVLMIVLDATIVNVALPSMKDDLGFSDGSLSWVVNAYLIAFGGLLLLAGRLGDLFGQRRIFLIGLTAFTASSLLCALAQNQGMLIGARFVQGVSGALASAVVLGMIVTMFPEPKEQAKAIGVYGFVASAGGSIGLLAGGVLTQAISWHWIFFINVPIGVATVVLARRLVADAPGLGVKAGADIPGAALLTGGLMVGVYAIVGIERHGAGSPQTLGFGALSIALITAFLVRQGRIANPLMPLRLFRSRNVVGANVVMALLVVGMFAMFFLGALYMQQVLGYDALGVGLAFLPSTIVMGAMSLRGAARFTIRFGAKTALITSLVAIMVGLLLFSQTPTDGRYVVDILPAMTFIGFGAGLSFPPLMTLAMSGATPSDSGLASGLINTTVQVGGAIGLAVLATLASERTHGLRADGEVTNVALNSGYHLAYLVGAGFAAAAIVFAVVVLRSAPVGDEQAVSAADEPHGAAVEVSQASGDPAGLPAYSEA